ncbi:PREDICTED: uncharacterized protein C1orf106 homolog [Galeopterus variegatus]|uniref:Uncharacterized protein C1orf106 homolog n=1 Tax=Galeopterus variegatus TaxID=482537 RepID=A0ABM0RWX5_GALVR|nr:PREDICTED: uncharacterized protein C1orf106 homolog [Galeopterus variegatus]
MPQGTDVLGSLTFGMLQMPKLNEIPPGREGRGETRGEGRWPGRTGPEAARRERGARGQAGGARAPWDSWGNSRLPTHPGPGWERCHPSPPCALSSQNCSMESKDEVSDTDSGVILQSGPDSPVSPMRELTHAVRKQQRALEARLEACLEELRRLCLREAELTGTLPAEYPPKPGEKPPRVRRRIGAAYKLDEWALHREVSASAAGASLSPDARALGSMGARDTHYVQPDGRGKVCRHGGHASRELREDPGFGPVGRGCVKSPGRHPQPQPRGRSLRGQVPPAPKGGSFSAREEGELSVSNDSSLSDGLLLEEEESQVPKPPPESPAPPSRPLPPQSLEGLKPAGPEAGGLERAPIQNSPWKETSLDHPYEKPRKSSEPSSESSSPASTPQDGPSASSLWLLEPASYHMVPIHSIPGQWQGRTSAPATPEMQGRRGQSQSLSTRLCKVRTPSLKDSPAGRGLSKAAVSEELKWWHERARLRSARPHSLDRQGAFRVRSLPPGREGFGRALGSRTQVPTVCVLRRSPEGAPVQVFVPENGEIISQV